MEKCANKLFEIFTFAVYVRLLLEAFHSLSLSSTHEINTFDASDTSKMLSLISAFVVFLVCLAMLGLMLVEWVRSRSPQIYSTQTYFKEILVGTKDNWTARSHSLLDFSRRLLLIVTAL